MLLVLLTILVSRVAGQSEIRNVLGYRSLTRILRHRDKPLRKKKFAVMIVSIDQERDSHGRRTVEWNLSDAAGFDQWMPPKEAAV